jgi:hypothetical protein
VSDAQPLPTKFSIDPTRQRLLILARLGDWYERSTARGPHRSAPTSGTSAESMHRRRPGQCAAAIAHHIVLLTRPHGAELVGMVATVNTPPTPPATTSFCLNPAWIRTKSVAADPREQRTRPHGAAGCGMVGTVNTTSEWRSRNGDPDGGSGQNWAVIQNTASAANPAHREPDGGMVARMAANTRTRRRKHAASSNSRSRCPDGPSSGWVPATASRRAAHRGVAPTGNHDDGNISVSVPPRGADDNAQEHSQRKV